MLRAVIYARFSSDMQREESIDAQVRACRDYCNKKHYIVTHVYKDEARSGKSLVGRDEYNQMMVDAMSHKFDVIVFHKIDRNARNEFNYYEFKHTLTQLGISYEYAVQNIDSSPEGQMLENMLVGFAAYYSRNLAKETKKGLNENAYKAMFNGGTAPFGYKIENQQYVIDQHEAEGVRMIFDMYTDGNGYTKISNALRMAGYKTKAGNSFSKNSIYDILGNEKYIGTYTFNKVTKRTDGKRNSRSKPSDELIKIPDAIPAIISKEQFALVAQIRKDNKYKSKRFTTAANYILSGKIFCSCGSPMNGHCIRKKYFYYACSKKERTPGFKCTQGYVDKDKLESWVIQTIEREIFSPVSMTRFSNLMQEEYKKLVNNSKEILKDINAKEVIATKKLNAIYSIIETGTADSFDLERLKTVKEEILDLRQKKKDLQENASLNVLTQEQIEKTLTALHEELENKHDLAIKQLIVNLFLEKIVVEKTKISMYINMEKVVAVKLVPRTGIEPVRVSLPEGF